MDYERDRGPAMQDISFQTTTSIRSAGFLAILIRLALTAAAGVALLTMVLVGFFVVLPMMLVGGIASYLYLRRRIHLVRRRARNDVIDAEYTVIDRFDA